MAREIQQERKTVELLEAHETVARKDGRCGWPDRQVFLGNGRHVWIEHKTDRGRLTPAQKRVFPKIEARGDVIIYGKGMTPQEIVAAVFRARGYVG